LVWQSFRRSLRSLRGGLRGSCVGLRKSRGVTRRKIRQRRNARPFPTDEPRRKRIDSTENEKDYKGISSGVRGIEAKGAGQSRCQCCCQSRPADANRCLRLVHLEILFSSHAGTRKWRVGLGRIDTARNRGSSRRRADPTPQLRRLLHAASLCRSVPLIIAAPFSTIIIVGRSVLVEVTAGMAEPL